MSQGRLQCFTTLTLTSVVCKRICVFILLPLFCVSIEVTSSNLRHPCAYWTKPEDKNNLPLLYSTCTETQDCLQCLQTYPLHAPGVPVLQLSCIGLPSYPVLSLFSLGALCHPHYALLWTETQFSVTFLSTFPARKTHSPSLHVGHRDCLFIRDFWVSNCATFGRLPFLCWTAHISTEDWPSWTLHHTQLPHSEALCKQLCSNSVGQKLGLPVCKCY